METRLLESDCIVRGLLKPRETLELGERYVADRLEQPSVVEPVDPLQRRELDIVDVPPRAASADHLGLVEADSDTKCAAPEVRG